MLRTIIQAMRAGGMDTPKITTGINDLRALTVPVTELVARKPSPTYQHLVDDIRPIRDLVQRDMSGAKATNAKTKLPLYIGKKLSPTGEWMGPVWTFTIWLPDQLEAEGSGDEVLTNYQLDPTNLGFYLDGESRGLSLETMILAEEDPDRRKALMNIRLPCRSMTESLSSALLSTSATPTAWASASTRRCSWGTTTKTGGWTSPARSSRNSAFRSRNSPGR